METESVSEDNMEDFLGRRVRKHFEGHGYFVGEVVSYNHTRKFFRVTYEDGDKEEVDLSELQEILWDTSVTTNVSRKRRTGKKGKAAGRKVGVRKVSTDGENMSLKKVGLQAGQAIRTENLQTSQLSPVEEQSCESLFLQSAHARLQGSKLVAIEDRVCQSIRKYFKTLVGSTVNKFFEGHGHFLGTVVAYHHRHRFFTVEYIDGDVEDLHWSELQEIMVDVPVCKLSREVLQAFEDQAARTKDVAMTNPPEDKADEIGGALKDDFEGKIEKEAGRKTSKSLTYTCGDTTSINSNQVTRARTGAEGTAGGNEAMRTKFGSHETVYASNHELNTNSQAEVKVGQKKPWGETEDMYLGGIRKYYNGIVNYVNAETELAIGSHLLRTQVSSVEDVADNEDGGDSVSSLRKKEYPNQGKRFSANRSGGTSRVRGAEPYESTPVKPVCEHAVLKPQTVKPGRPSTSSYSSKPHDHYNRQLVGRTVRKHFKGFGDFTGEVISYDVHSGYFKVEYSDGDREEVDLTELSEIIAVEEFFGRTVWKHFEGSGDFEGEVVSYDDDRKYFMVEYRDGDMEEVDFKELVRILVADEPAEWGRKREHP